MRTKLTKLTASKKVLIALVAAVVVALVGTSVGYAAMNKTVTLSVDGTASQVQTTGDTVGDVLASQDLHVGAHDIVAPGVDTPVNDGSRIAVRFGRPLKLDVDGDSSTYWVTATDVGSALEQVGVRYQDADLSASRGMFLGRDGTTLHVTTPKKVTIKVGRHHARTVDDPTTTVRDLLHTLDVSVDKNDQVKPRAQHRLQDGDKVVVTKVRVVKHRVRHQAIDHAVHHRYDSSLLKGKTRTVRSGHDGTRAVTYRLRYENGQLKKRKMLHAKVLRNPVATVLRIGTKQPPPPSPEPTTNYASGSTVWDRLAQCESGGNWATDTGNGYYGGLQFDLQTWHSYGGSGYPNDASRSTQIAIATKVRDANGGYSAWPSCASQLGLPT